MSEPELVRFPVEGMFCSSCVGHITKAVRRVAGVESVNVDLGSDSVTVAFDSALVPLTSIAAAIEAIGYVARIEKAEPVTSVHARGGFLARLRPG